MKLLSSGEVCEIAALPLNTLDRWCSGDSVDLEGPVVVPYQEATGRGRHRRFTVAQAVGLAFAAQWREWGAGWALLEPMLRSLMKLTERKMLAAFAEGRTHILELPGNKLEKPQLPLANGKLFDLFSVYERVQESISRMQHDAETSAKKPGRKRALATAKGGRSNG
jgi:hypothetical protein